MSTMDDNALETGATETPTQPTQEQQKTYTQEEFDKHMAGMRKSIESKFEKQFAELGDLDELKQLKTAAEQQRQEEAIKKGEFEKILQEKISAKDAEIQKRDGVIKEYKVNSPLLDAAARYKAVAPEQVRSLLTSNVRLNSSGEVEVVDAQGTTRYGDAGTPLTVDDLVKEFLDSNPHFVQPGASTTNTRSQVSPTSASSKFSLDSLDLTNAEHRKMYKEAKEKGLL